MTEKKYLTIIDYLKTIIRKTEFEGHLFAVGGCERDRLLGNEIKDIDLVLDIPNGGILFAQWLENHDFTKGSVVIYEHFGTAMFHLKAFPSFELEAVQTRSECYHDMESRNPDTVFGTLEEDCHRRDFTVNAIYRNVSTGEVLDINGQSFDDLKHHIIRTCGNPNIIFKEDPLRIMRMVRFMSKLGFMVDNSTLSGAFFNAHRLSIISQERLTDEFNKIITSRFSGSGLMILMSMECIKSIVGDDEPCLYKKTVKSCYKCMKIDRSDDIEVSLAIFFYDLTLSEAETVMKHMKYSNAVINNVLFILSHRNFNEHFITDAEIRRTIYESGTPEAFKKLLKFYEAYCCIDTKAFETMIDDPEWNVYFNYKLPINGNDIMKYMEMGEGPYIKEISKALLFEAFEVGKDFGLNNCLRFLKQYKRNIDEKDN